MTPGYIRPTSRAEAIARARSMCGPAGARIVYRLADQSGGRDPTAPDPASHWLTRIRRVAVASCDCAGFVAWALGFDRYQPGKPGKLGGWDWINCDSAIADAYGLQAFFMSTPKPEPGDLIVFPSIDIDHDGSRDRVGHVGLLTEVAAGWQPGLWGLLRAAHCSDGNQTRFGRAIAETTALSWSGAESFRGRKNDHWGAVFLRYQRFAPF